MVRSIEDCRSGTDAIKELFKRISQTNTAESILDEEFTSFFQTEEFFESISSEDEKLWITEKHITVLESVQEALVKGNIMLYIMFIMLYIMYNMCNISVVYHV